jgi:type I restriction enzyme R subunit
VRIAPDDIRKKGKVPKNGSIFFTIFQTFMSGPPKDGSLALLRRVPAGLLRLHRHRRMPPRRRQRRKQLARHPRLLRPAVQLGLTATPKRKDNVDTYAYFGEPVFIYSLKDGINDGFLTPFRVKQIATTLDEYVYTPDDTVVEGEIEAGKRYEEADFNKIIEIKEREKQRVEIVHGADRPARENAGLLRDQEHALAIRDLINQMKTSSDPNYCQRVTADDGALGEQWLRDFQDNEKTIPPS